MEKKDIEKLGELAKIEINEADVDGFKKDFESILDYVSQVESVDVSDVKEDYPFVGITREDGNAISPGTHTEDILKGAPDTDNGFIKVKKIL